MSGIIGRLRMLFGGEEDVAEADSPDPELAYVLYWMKTARSWPADRREQVRLAVLEITEAGEFTANTFQRRYRVAGLDDSLHAGASLVALLKVLDGLDEYQQTEEESKS